MQMMMDTYTICKNAHNLALGLILFPIRLGQHNRFFWTFDDSSTTFSAKSSRQIPMFVEFNSVSKLFDRFGVHAT